MVCCREFTDCVHCSVQERLTELVRASQREEEGHTHQWGMVCCREFKDCVHCSVQERLTELVRASQREEEGHTHQPYCFDRGCSVCDKWESVSHECWHG